MRSRGLPGLALAAVLAAGCAHEEPPPTKTVAAELVPQPVAARGGTLPTGTKLIVQLDRTLDGNAVHAGDEFRATLAQPLLSTDGRTLIAAGVQVIGRVTGVHAPVREGDQGAIRLQARGLIAGSGATQPIRAEVSALRLPEEGVGGRRSVPPNTPPGAVRGTLVGGGAAAAVLPLLGAGSGTVFSLGRGDQPPILPAGTSMVVRLLAPSPAPGS